MHIRLLWSSLKQEDYLKTLGADWRITFKWTKETGLEGVECIHLTQDRDKRRAFVNTVITFGLRIMRGKFYLGEKLLASSGLCPMQ
jgi:hypothetical protein